MTNLHWRHDSFMCMSAQQCQRSLFGGIQNDHKYLYMHILYIMYLHMYIYIHVCIRMYMYIIHTGVYICMYMYTYAYMYEHISTYGLGPLQVRSGGP